MSVSSRLDGTRAISDNAFLTDFEGIILRDAQISLEQGRSKRKPEAYSLPVRRGLERSENEVIGLFQHPTRAEVAELADALDSGSSARKGVRVQIPASAPSRQLVPSPGATGSGRNLTFVTGFAHPCSVPDHTRPRNDLAPRAHESARPPGCAFAVRVREGVAGDRARPALCCLMELVA